jgi:hypothetical protein
MCEEFLEACGEEVVAETLEVCIQVCVDNPDGARATITAAANLPCSVVVPQVIAGFGIEEECGGEERALVGVVVTSDYITSEIYTVTGPGEDDKTLVTTTSGDTLVSALPGNRFAIIDRAEATITTYTWIDGEPIPGWSTATGEGSNPQDVAQVRPNAYYIARYEHPSILIVDGDGNETGEINLSDGIGDGIADMDRIFVRDDYAYVVLQNLEGFVPVENSKLAVIDIASDELVQTLDLEECPNASSAELYGNDIFLVCTGEYGVPDGRIHAVNIEDPGNPQERDVSVTEAALGGDLLRIAHGANGFYLGTSNEDFSNNLVYVSDENETTTIIDGGVVGGMASVFGFGAAVCTDRGVIIFDSETPTEPSPPVTFAMPPREVVFLR